MNILTKQNFIDIFNNPVKSCILSTAQWSHLIFILRECDLLARYYYLSQQAGCFIDYPDKAKHHLTSAKVQADRQAKQARFEAYEIDKNLSAIDVRPIFLKGVAYTLRDCSASLGRIYSDMDILVDKKQLLNIERKLSFFGWFVKKTDDYDQKYYREWAHEIPPMQQASRGTVADIHHNLLPPISGKAPDIKLFTNNLYTTQAGLLTLSKSAMVLHSIIHLFFNEEFSHGFRDLSDLHLLFTEEDNRSSFWEELLSLSKRANFEKELFYAVRYCTSITKTEFPAEFISAINKFNISHTRIKFIDFIFKNALQPLHPSFSTRSSKLALSLAMLRGHLLKMPLHILIYHSLHKLFDSTVKAFSKSDNS